MNEKPVTDINKKLNEYWDGIVYDIQNRDMPAYMNLLKDKYGTVFEEHENIISGDMQITPIEAKEIYDYAYKTGPYKDYDLIQEYYRREVLKTLIKNIKQNNNRLKM